MGIDNCERTYCNDGEKKQRRLNFVDTPQKQTSTPRGGHNEDERLE